MLASILAIAMMGQMRPDFKKDFNQETNFYKWVQEAKSQADQWAFTQSARLYPNSVIGRVGVSDPWKARQMYEARKRAPQALKEAAYKQIREAYGISEMEFQRILRMQDIRRLHHNPERLPSRSNAGAGIASRNPLDLKPTRFDPSKVRMPDLDRESKPAAFDPPARIPDFLKGRCYEKDRGFDVSIPDDPKAEPEPFETPNPGDRKIQVFSDQAVRNGASGDGLKAIDRRPNRAGKESERKDLRDRRAALDNWRAIEERRSPGTSRYSRSEPGNQQPRRKGLLSQTQTDEKNRSQTRRPR